MMAVAAAGLVIPALRAAAPTAERRDYDLTVYRDQLRDLKADVARGVITPEDEESARTEISRRMIAAGAPTEDALAANPKTKSTPRIARIVVTAFVILAVPVIATPIYLVTGSPETPGQPFASRTDIRVADEATLPEGFEEGVARLVARLEEEPDDFEGWVMLGRALMIVPRYDAAVDAFRRATALSPKNSQAQSLLGEAIVFAAGGTVTPPALRAFEAASAADPKNIAARFYRAVERAQAGEVQEAFDAWLALVADSPADAPWLPDLRARLEEAAEILDVDLAALLPDPLPPGSDNLAQPPAPNGPPPADADQQAQIRSMVARLAARLETEPDDADGWLMLGRSYGVLGDSAGSRTAYARAAELRPDDVQVLAAYARSLMDDPPSAGPLPAPARDLYSRILDLDGENSEALYFLGLADVQSGNAEEGIARWEHLLTLLEPSSEAYRVVEEGLKNVRPSD